MEKEKKKEIEVHSIGKDATKWNIEVMKAREAKVKVILKSASAHSASVRIYVGILEH